MARSSFHQRFTNELAELMLQLVQRAIHSSKGLRRLGGAVDAFREVLAIDSSIVRVSPELKKNWPGAWSHHSPAAVKVTAVTNVVGRDLRRVRFSPGSRHDVHLLESGSWMKDRLIIFDLGFFKAELFKEVDAADGHFLCRLKKQSNPWIIDNYNKGGANLTGKRLKEAQKELFRETACEVLTLCQVDRPRETRALLEFWISEAPDPNRNRPLLAEKSSMGVCAFD